MAQSYGVTGMCAVVGVLCAVASAYTLATVVRSTTSTTYPNAERDCIGRGGGVAITTSTGQLSVVEMTSGGVIWLGGYEQTPGVWVWTGGVTYTPQNPKVFWVNNQCAFGLCAWAPGEPRTGAGGHMILVAQRYRTTAASNPNFYECELPYTVVYRCYRQDSGTNYDVVHEKCLVLGGYLGTVPTLESWSAVLQSPGCANLPDTRLGADDYKPNAFETSDFTPEFRGFYHWRGGPLGQERGGLGRLLSSGANPQTTLYGYPTLPYASGQPTVGTSQHTIEVIASLQQLNDYTWRAQTPPHGPYAWVCEFPAPPPPPPPPPPGPGPTPTPSPPAPTTTPTPTNPPGSCFPTADVTVTDALEVTGCVVRGGRIVVLGSLTMTGATLENVVIEVDGQGGVRVLDIRDSTLNNVGILVNGRFAGNSVIRVANSTIAMTAPVDLGQRADIAAWVHIVNGVFEASGLVELVRNTISMGIVVPTATVAVVYASTATTMQATPLRIVDNTVRVSGAGPTSALVLSEGNVTLDGTSLLEILRNVVTLTADVTAVFMRVPFLIVSEESRAYVTDNVASLFAARGMFFVGGVVDRGVMEWRHNEVRYGSSVPTFVDSAVQLPAGSRAVLTENILTSDGSAAVPARELSGPVTGAGTLAAGCTLYFGRLLLTLADLSTILPAFANTVLEPCTSRFVPTGAVGGGSSVGGAVASGSATSTLVPIIVGSILAFLALVLIVVIVFTLWHRGRRVSHRSRYAKSARESSQSGSQSRRSSRRSSSSRNSLRGSSHSGSGTLTAATA